MIAFFHKHPRLSLLTLLFAGFIFWINTKPKEKISSASATVEQSFVKNNSSSKVVSRNVASSASTAEDKESQKLEERRKKREAFYAKLDECDQIEEEIKRPARDNFKRKVLAYSSDLGEWFFNKQAPLKEILPVSSVDKFFRAIALSGLQKNSKHYNYLEDIPTALKLADEVIGADPTNSAGYLLKARLLDSQNKINEAQITLDEAEQKTNHFDTGMIGVMRKMTDVSDGAADMLLIREFQTPMLIGSSLVIKIIAKYKKVKLGEQIMKPAYDDSKLINELEWSSWDYQNAKYALQEFTGKKFKDHMEIIPKKEEILAVQFPEFDPSKRQEIKHDRDNVDCVNTAEMEKGLFLVKKALARSK